MQTMLTLYGKKALVTGAASGIGRAIALALAEQGTNLYLLDVDDEGLKSVVAETSARGVEVIAERCDLGRQDEISLAVYILLKRWSHIDILVNNAGIAYYGPTERMSAEQWNRLLNINLLAPIHLTRELLPTLLERPDAHLLNVCSISGLVAGGRFAAYHVSKFGLVGFTEAMRAEYGRRGLGVTALCPGPVRTKLYTSAMSGKPGKAVPTPPAWICTTEERVAAAAVQAILHNKRMVLLTPLAHVLYSLKRFAPWFLDFLNHIGRKRKKLSSSGGSKELPGDNDTRANRAA
jgi:short-subunit dehydrogenase